MERINYPSEGLYYEGEVKDGVPDGQGTFYYVDGKPNKGGSFVGGKLQGKGWMYFEDGSNYKGEFKDDLPDGLGRSFSPDGKMTYEGSYLKGERSGQGVEYENGVRIYSGGFQNDKYNGKGAEFYCSPQDAVAFNGEFKKGMWSKGRYYDTEGSLMFEGEFYLKPDNISDFKSGRFYDDGNLVFEGEFYLNQGPDDGLCFKSGRLYLPSKSSVLDGKFGFDTSIEGMLQQFTGYREFYCDLELTQDGQPMMKNCESVYTGKPHFGLYFKDGEATNIVVEFSTSKDLTTGRYLRTVAYDEHNPYRFCQRFDSRGGVESTFENGHLTEYYFSLDRDKTVKYQGEGKLDYLYPCRHGKGKLYDAKGHLIYEGEFKDGQYNGLGKQYGEDGQIIYEGKFLCGKPEEEFKKSPGYSDYLKKEEERKAKEAAKALEAKKKAEDEKNGKIGCAIIIIIVIILANIL